MSNINCIFGIVKKMYEIMKKLLTKINEKELDEKLLWCGFYSLTASLLIGLIDVLVIQWIAFAAFALSSLLAFSAFLINLAEFILSFVRK